LTFIEPYQRHRLGHERRFALGQKQISFRLIQGWHDSRRRCSAWHLQIVCRTEICELHAVAVSENVRLRAKRCRRASGRKRIQARRSRQLEPHANKVKPWRSALQGNFNWFWEIISNPTYIIRHLSYTIRKHFLLMSSCS